MYDLIIIGAGPAGLTAGLYAGRYRVNTLILEKLTPGGRILLTETIENFPGFAKGVATRDLMHALEEQVKELVVNIELEEVLELDSKSKTVKTETKIYKASSIIIAAGSKPRKLDVLGEDKLIGRGVSYCATCDGPLYKDKKAVVVGGGNAAAEEALYLTRFASSVSLVHRRNELRASKILQEKLRENKKINFILDNTVTEIMGDSRVESIKIINKETNQGRVLACDGVFIYIGSEPNTAFIKHTLKMDEQGFLITDENMMTSQEGIFACGDCRRKSLYQVINACGEGAVAADSAQRYLLNR